MLRQLCEQTVGGVEELGKVRKLETGQKARDDVAWTKEAAVELMRSS